jgi:uncharacterized RDD family membrane protein YckC
VYPQNKRKPQSLNSHLKPAPALNRLSAQLIDVCLLYAIAFLLSVYLGPLGAILSAVIGLLYFWLCHQFVGQTLGKKLMGLRVVSVHPVSLNAFRTITRESLGRLVCLGTLFLGYLGVVFRKDGRAFHDLISGTIVISEKGHPSAVLQFAGALLALTMTVSSSAYFLFFKTPILATIGTQVLHRQGMDIQTLSGTIEKGWKIDTFQGKNSVFNFVIKGIHIKHDKTGFYHSGLWRFSEISIDEVAIHLAPGAVNFNYLDRDLASADLQWPLASTYTFFGLKFLVNSLRINKISFFDKEKLNLVFTDVDAQKIRYGLGTLNVDGIVSGKKSSNKIEVSQFVLDVAQKKMLLKAKLFAKKHTYSALQKDVQISMIWSGSLKKPERFRLLAFEDRLTVDYFRNDLIVTIQEFSPASYFKATPTFKNITAKLRNSHCLAFGCLEALQGSGSFYTSQQKVNFKNKSAWFVGVNEEVLPFNYNHLVKALFQPMPVLSVVSEETVPQFISQLYFKKPLEGLNETEQSVVRRDQVYYKVLRERFDPNRPRHRDTFLLRSPSELSEVK